MSFICHYVFPRIIKKRRNKKNNWQNKRSKTAIIFGFMQFILSDVTSRQRKSCNSNKISTGINYNKNKVNIYKMY